MWPPAFAREGLHCTRPVAQRCTRLWRAGEGHNGGAGVDGDYWSVGASASTARAVAGRIIMKVQWITLFQRVPTRSDVLKYAMFAILAASLKASDLTYLPFVHSRVLFAFPRFSQCSTFHSRSDLSFTARPGLHSLWQWPVRRSGLRPR